MRMLAQPEGACWAHTVALRSSVLWWVISTKQPSIGCHAGPLACSSPWVEGLRRRCRHIDLVYPPVPSLQQAAPTAHCTGRAATGGGAWSGMLGGRQAQPNAQQDAVLVACEQTPHARRHLALLSHIGATGMVLDLGFTMVPAKGTNATAERSPMGGGLAAQLSGSKPSHLCPSALACPLHRPGALLTPRNRLPRRQSLQAGGGRNNVATWR